MGIKIFKVGLDFFAVGNERGELIGIDISPLVIATGVPQSEEQGL